MHASELLGDKWTLQILREAMYGVRRFADLREELGLPSAALSGRLAKMVEHGLLNRMEYRDEGSRTRHEYVLTSKGMELVYVLAAMMEWGARHMDLDPEEVPELRHVETGERITVGFVRSDDGGIAPANVRLGSGDE